jgi:hypothetical protein
LRLDFAPVRPYDRQIEIIASATPKRDYYCQSQRGNVCSSSASARRRSSSRRRARRGRIRRSVAQEQGGCLGRRSASHARTGGCSMIMPMSNDVS